MGKARQSRKGDPKVAVGYLRVSTDDQNLGPDAQRAALERWAAATGVRIVAYHEDHGVSGATSVNDRPGFLAALDDLAEHGAGILAVAKRDRLARDPIVGAFAEARIEHEGARVVSAAGEGSESNDPSNVLMRRMVDAFAEYERGIIRDRTRRALAVLRGRGFKTGGDVPFGYQVDGDGKTLARNETEQGVIVRVRALRADGLTLRAIAARLNLDGCSCRGSRWHPTTVARIVARGETAA